MTSILEQLTWFDIAWFVLGGIVLGFVIGAIFVKWVYNVDGRIRRESKLLDYCAKLEFLGEASGIGPEVKAVTKDILYILGEK